MRCHKMTITKDKIKKYVQQVANNVCFPHIFAQQSPVLTAYKSLTVCVFFVAVAIFSDCFISKEIQFATLS